jgi:hypothetical protein
MFDYRHRRNDALRLAERSNPRKNQTRAYHDATADTLASQLASATEAIPVFYNEDYISITEREYYFVH